MKLEMTPKHSSASNPAERAIQAVEEQARTIREDCQMRCGNGETFGADKPIWAWLLRHAGWQISRYEQKGNGMTAYKQAYGSSRVFGLVEERRRTNTWSGHTWRSSVFSYNSTTGTSRRHDAVFLSNVKGLTMGCRRWYSPGSTKKRMCTTTTHSGWREHTEPQSGPAKPDCRQAL